MSAAELLISRATRAECVLACRDWHYTGTAPQAQIAAYRVSEGGEFAGVVLFGAGANRNLAAGVGVAAGEGCELTRVALAPRRSAVSRVVAICLRLLRAARPALRAVVSYADPARGHHDGTIRVPGLTLIKQPRKHAYACGLNPEDRARLAARALPYPKRDAGAVSSTPAGQAGGHGAIPMASLHTPALRGDER